MGLRVAFVCYLIYNASMRVQCNISAYRSVSYTAKDGKPVTGFEVWVSHDLLKGRDTVGVPTSSTFLRSDRISGAPALGPGFLELELRGDKLNVAALEFGKGS